MSFSVSVDLAFSTAVDDRHRRGEAAGGEEVRRRVEALLMLGDQPVVHRILGDVVIVIGRALEAGEALVGGERGQDVAAGRKLDAVAAGVEIGELVERIAAARPDDPDDLAAGLILQRVEQALRGGGEIGGVDRRIFLGVERSLRSWPAPALNAATPSRPKA